MMSPEDRLSAVAALLPAQKQPSFTAPFTRGESASTLAGCWAHARPKFYEVREQSPRVSGWILRHLQHLYALESQLRQAHAGPKLRQAERAAHSRMILARLRRALQAQQRRHLPQSLIGVAITYALDQWSMLKRFIEGGRIEIDNTLVENAIRPTAVGKKNWLFVSVTRSPP